MINHKFSLPSVFQQILYWTNDWINEGSGWIIELIKSQYINISTYRPLSGSSYIKRTNQHKKNDQKCCHVRHINPVKIHPKRITQADKKLANNFNYDKVGFPTREKGFSKIETKNNICINVFCYENTLTFPICNSDQKIENSMDLLLGTDKNKSHYVYIKNFDRFMFHK